MLSRPGQAQASQPFRIGYLHPLSDTETGSGTSGPEIIQRELARLGYIEGKNVIFERRFADGRPERLPELAAELVMQKVDIIIAQTTAAAIAAKQVTNTVPIVFTSSGDAVGTGLVASLARPGGNATGNSFLGSELAVKQLELLRELLPTISRVAFVGNSRLPPEPLFFQQMQDPAQRLGFTPVFIDVRGPDEFERAVAELQRQRMQAAIWAPGGYTDRAADRARLLDANSHAAVPALYFRREFVEHGGLMSFGPNFPDLYRTAASYVDRILRGEKAADLTVQQPKSFELAVNLKTAKALNIPFPASILARADEVIE